MYHANFNQAQMSGVPFDVDAILYEMSMARSQMAYQVSGSAYNYRQRQTRVTKPISAGSSPQHVQRRRTTSLHRTGKYKPDLYPQALQAVQPNVLNIQEQQQQSTAPPRARPTSWHPSTVVSRNTRPVSYASSTESPYLSVTNEYHTVAVNGMPTPMTQPEMSSDIPIDPYFTLDNTHDCTPAGGHYSAGLMVNTSFHHSHIMDPSSLYSLSSVPSSDNYLTFSPAASQRYAWTGSVHTASAHTAPPTPDLLPIQKPEDSPSDDIESMNDEPDLPPLTRQDSSDLVGMGLYDDVAPKGMSSGLLLGTILTSDANEPTGKGLKLEETWEPPEGHGESDDDDDEADGEGEDEDEAEEVVVETQEELPRKAPGNEIAGGVSTTQAPRHVVSEDITGQSFFIDNGDENSYGYVAQSMFQLMHAAQQPITMTAGGMA